MEQQNEKCIMLLDESLPVGLIANTAAILGITIGRERPDVVGADVTDAGGYQHLGITKVPIPILKGNRETLRILHRRLCSEEYTGLTVVGFTDLAQGCNSYDQFTEQLAERPEETLSYLGIAICGDKKKINRLTGSLPLLR